MFYAHFVLSKKGPLARIWLAAHWDKKLTRSQVFETNITSSVEAILEPKVKLALRTSGHLLLGVVRIHSRQAKYLLSDCNEAFVKIKMAFRPGADLTDDTHRDSTSLAAITLSDNIHDFESTLADINDMDPFGIAVNQSRPEDITMREEFGEPNLGRPDDDFGDSTFEDAGDRDFVGEPINMDHMDDNNEADMTLTHELVKNQSSHVFPEMPSSVGMGNNDSDFADVMDVDYEDSESVENLETMFQDTVVNAVSESVISGVESRMIDDSTLDNNDTVMVEASSTSELATVIEEESIGQIIPTMSNEKSVPPPMTMGISAVARTPGMVEPLELVLPSQQPAVAAAARQLPQFVLPPIDRSLRENRRAPKRKRKLLIDEHKSIPSDVMKLQMQDTSEITTRLDLAPPTRKLMLWKETGNVEALFTTPGRAIPSRILQKLFYRNMKTVPVPNDALDGLPVICGVRRCGGFLNLDEEVNNSDAASCVSAVINNNNNNNNTSWSEAIGRGTTSINNDNCSITDPSNNMTPIGIHSHLQQHLSNISEEAIIDDNNDLSEHHLPAGACSSYSTNYDCWSGGHTTPHHGGGADIDDEPLTSSYCNNNNNNNNTNDAMGNIILNDEDNNDDIINQCNQSVIASSTIATGNNNSSTSLSPLKQLINISNNNSANISMIDQTSNSSNNLYMPSNSLHQNNNSYANISDLSIEKARDASIDLSTSAFTNDFSIVLDQSMDRTIISDDNSRLNESRNKLQNTMVMLDQQLDQVNEEYPLEITQEGLEKRSEIMLNVLRNAIKHDGTVDFQHLTVSNNKKQAASKFYTLLLLGKQKKLKMYQETPLSNIIITKVEYD